MKVKKVLKKTKFGKIITSDENFFYIDKFIKNNKLKTNRILGSIKNQWQIRKILSFVY
tara:strand:+ start:138 stop:311 length:174 start_codon:yes stop_codon:yes gene_type:complete